MDQMLKGERKSGAPHATTIEGLIVDLVERKNATEKETRIKIAAVRGSVIVRDAVTGKALLVGVKIPTVLLGLLTDKKMRLEERDFVTPEKRM